MAQPADRPSSAGGLTNLQKRSLSAAVLLPLVIAAIVLGAPWLNVLVAVFAVAMAWEWTSVVATIRSPGETKPVPTPSARGWGILAAISAATAVLAVWRASLWKATPVDWWFESAWVVILAGVVIAAIVSLIADRQRVAWYCAGIPYVTVPPVALILLRDDPDGPATIVWMLALVVAADTGGYLVGRTVGGPKLAPRISPNKTWSGLGGAVAGAALVGLLTAFILNHTNVLMLTLISAVIGLLEQGGDLVESAFKRHFGVKDTSQIIPGHGGVLDRVDGLLAVAVAVLVISLLAGGSVLAW
jgi:phosphatidate cytidylyltransferase